MAHITDAEYLESHGFPPFPDENNRKIIRQILGGNNGSGYRFYVYNIFPKATHNDAIHEYIISNKQKCLEEIEEIEYYDERLTSVGIVKEILGDASCIIAYKKGVNYDNEFACERLCKMYNPRVDNDTIPIKKSYVLSEIYHYKYKKILDTNEYTEGCCNPLDVNGPNMSSYFEELCYNDKFMCDIFDNHINSVYKVDSLTRKNKKLLDQIEELKKENKELLERVTELEYAPGGVGYHACKEHFEELCKKQENA